MLRVLVKIIVLVVEKIISEIALVAAFVSMAHQGRLLQRMLGSLTSLYDMLYGFVSAYAKNVQFRDVWARFTANFDQGLEAAAKNIETEPHLVLYAFIATIVCFKLAAWLLKLFRKNMLKRRPKAMKPSAKGMRKTPGTKSVTYDRLYEPPEVSPSTSAQLERMKKPPTG